jgi:hypothetical protein
MYRIKGTCGLAFRRAVRLDFFTLMADEQNWKKTDVGGTTVHRRTWNND